MAIRIVSNISVEPSQIQDYLDYWAHRSPQCRAEPGCLQYQVLRSVEIPNEFALLELWEDQETYDTHWAAQLQIPNRPAFARVPRTHGRDGLEFYFDQRYYHLENGQWVADEPAPR
jgi:quinol monooxygenase YgiN